MRGPSIEFDRVGLALGNTTILEDGSFGIRAGTIHCIVGANGGGKTSLVRSLVGQMPHTGRIAIEWGEGRVIGYVPQTLDFDKSLPITDSDFMAMTCQRRPVFLGVSRSRRAMIEGAPSRLRGFPMIGLRVLAHDRGASARSSGARSCERGQRVVSLTFSSRRAPSRVVRGGRTVDTRPAQRAQVTSVKVVYEA